MDRFSTTDGLPDNQITALYQDDRGPLWIGTSAGLCRFDGRGFDLLSRYSGAPSNRIMGIFGAGQGRLWIVTEFRVYVFEDQSFNLIYQAENGSIEAASAGNNVLWIGMHGEIMRVTVTGDVRRYGAEVGIPDTSVTDISISPDGSPWVSYRLGGLSHLDDGWNHYGSDSGLSDLNVNQIAFGPKGEVWAATHRGICVLRANGFFEPIPMGDPTKHDIVFGILTDSKGRLWIRTATGLGAVWDGTTARYLSELDLSGRRTTAFSKDRRGQVWLATDRAVFRMVNGRFESVFQLHSGAVVSVFAQGPADTLWIGTNAGLLRAEDQRLMTHLSDPTSRALPNGSQARSIIALHDALWFPSLNGLGYHDSNGFRRFDEADGLPGLDVHHLLGTKDRQVYVGTPDGLASGGRGGFHEVALGEKSRAVLGIYSVPPNQVWVMDGSGQFWIHEESDPVDSFRPGHRFDSVIEVHPDIHGSAWIQTFQGIYLVEHGQPRLIPPSQLPQEQILDRHFSADGAVYFATPSGLYRFRQNELELVLGLSSERPKIPARIRAGANGALWLGLIEPPPEFPSRRSASGIARYADGRVQFFDRDNQIRLAWFSDVILTSDGREWIRHGQGVSIYASGRFEQLTIADGLTGNHVNAVAHADDGTVWIATNGGANCIRGDMISSLSIEDGLSDAFITDIVADRDGTIWLRTRTGVQSYSPLRTPPPISLVAVHDGDTQLPTTSPTQLRFNQNDLKFEVQGVHTQRGAEHMQFAYSLQGKDATWRHSQRESSIRFPGLKPGDYQLDVTAYNRDLVPSSNPVRYGFSILPPIWRQTWFVVLAGLSIAAAAFVVIRLRFHARLEQMRIVNELATANRVQISLLPSKAPKIAGIDIYGTCVPAREVGGDFYDYFWLDKSHQNFGLAIMDVSGKSMEAAIISVMTSGLIHAESARDHSPSSMIRRLNAALYEKTASNIFTTGLILGYTRANSTLTWCNAGHLDPIIIRDGHHVKLQSPERRDLPLGAVPNWDFREHSIGLQPDDVVLICTDGVTEATNAKHALFDERRVIDALESNPQGLSAKDIVDRLIQRIDGFAESIPQHDDLTAVVLRILDTIDTNHGTPQTAN